MRYGSLSDDRPREVAPRVDWTRDEVARIRAELGDQYEVLRPDGNRVMWPACEPLPDGYRAVNETGIDAPIGVNGWTRRKQLVHELECGAFEPHVMPRRVGTIIDGGDIIPVEVDDAASLQLGTWRALWTANQEK